MNAIVLTRRLFLCFGAMVLALSLNASAAGAPNVGAYVVEPSGTITDGIAQATFKVSVENHEPSDVTDFSIVFGDDSSVMIGSVPAGATVVSDPVSKTMDVSSMTTANAGLRVTLRYTFNGAAVEVPYTLTLARK